MRIKYYMCRSKNRLVKRLGASQGWRMLRGVLGVFAGLATNTQRRAGGRGRAGGGWRELFSNTHLLESNPVEIHKRQFKMSGEKVKFQNLVRGDLKGYCKAANMKFNEQIKTMLAEGRIVHHFGFGQAPFPVMEHMQEALKSYAGEAAYLPVAGIPQLRQAICKFHEKYDNLTDLDADNVIVGPGTKQLIYLMMMVFNGDVIVLSPSWTTYKPQASLAHHKAVVIETLMEDEWRLTPEAVEQAIENKTLKENRLLVLCNPDNPTGTSYSPTHLKALSKVFRKHRIIVVSDEIYGRLHYKQQHASLTKFYPEGTILSSGMSKWASAGGWRVGYHIYPPQLEELKAAVHSAASHTHSTCPAPMQFAVAKALSEEVLCEDYMKHTARVLEAVGMYCYHHLTGVGVQVVPPTAGYYIFPNFTCIREGLARRGIDTGEQMCQALLEEARVAVLAGGPAHLRPLDELTVRLCYVNFEGAQGLAASRKIGLDKDLPQDFVTTYCKPVCEGIQALKEWVEKHRV